MKFKLGDISTIKGGKRLPKGEKLQEILNNHPYLRIVDFDGFDFNKRNLQYVPNKVFEKIQKYTISKDDIFLSIVGTIGIVALIGDELDRASLTENAVKITVSNQVNKNYLYYFLQSQLGQEQINSLSVGSTQKKLPIKNIKKIEIDLPSLAVQKGIAHKLRILDEKIKLNRKINDNLTNQLHAISDNYFSYFNFNGGSIPKNWTYKNLADIAEITSGYSYKGKELVDSDLGMATIKNFARTGGFQINGYKSIIPSKNVKQSQYASLFDMLIAHTDLTQNADIIGNAEPVLTTSRFKKIIYSMDLVKVIPKQNKISKWLLDLILMSTRVKAHCLGYVNGTTVLHLSKKALKEFEIPLPNDPEELSGVTRIARNYLLMMSENMQENEKLIELKDQLLNKYF